jgi:hypothetical protein
MHSKIDGQIKRLQSLVGGEGMREADNIIKNHSPNVIRLAFRSLPRCQNPECGHLLFLGQSEFCDQTKCKAYQATQSRVDE